MQGDGGKQIKEVGREEPNYIWPSGNRKNYGFYSKSNIGSHWRVLFEGAT